MSSRPRPSGLCGHGSGLSDERRLAASASFGALAVLAALVLSLIGLQGLEPGHVAPAPWAGDATVPPLEQEMSYAP